MGLGFMVRGQIGLVFGSLVFFKFLVAFGNYHNRQWNFAFHWLS